MKIFFVFLLLTSIILGDDDVLKTKLNLNKNCIINHYKNDKLQNNLKNKIEKKDNLAIRIYGDSHIGGDFFSNKLRNLFFTPNSIGFTYALQPKYQQNSTLTYKYKNFKILNSKIDKNIKYPLGGIIAKAINDNAYIELDTNIKQKEFNFGILFKNPHKNIITIEDKNKKIHKIDTKIKNKWAYKELKLHFPIKIKAKKDLELGGFFIYHKNKNNTYLDTLGINGAKSDLYLEWNLPIVKKELNILKNDLIILAYGSNDALNDKFDKMSFKKNYKKLIHILQKANPKAIIVLISPPTTTQKIKNKFILSPNFNKVQKAICEIAKEEKLMLFNMHKFMKNTKGKNDWIKHKLSLKDVHLTIKGYELMAQKFYIDLLKTLKVKDI